MARFLVWDSVFLVVHALTVTVLVVVPLQRWRSSRRPHLGRGRLPWLAAVTIWVVGGLDAAENVCLALLLGDAQSAAASVLEPVTAVKLTLVPAVFALVFVAWLGLAWVALRRVRIDRRTPAVEFHHTH